AKLRSASKYNLATSAMSAWPLRDLGITIAELEINGPSLYGYGPLNHAIASRYRVPVECVVAAAGTSMANYLALAAVVNPGEEILVEHPTYELLLSAAEYLGIKVRRFRRDPVDFAIDLDDLARNLTPQTKAVVLCNLHNPTGQFTDDNTLRAIGGLAKNVGARVIVDEVYRELLWERQPRSAFHLDPELFVSTNSLTKAYGLGGLRCGWVLASSDLAQRMWRINDLHGSTPAHPGELISVAAFHQLNEIADKQHQLLDTNHALLKAFLDSRNDLDYYWPDFGAIVAPRLKHGDVNDFCDLFRTRFDGTVVPGHFFEMPRHFRIGIGLPTGQIAPALDQLARALDAYQLLNGGSASPPTAHA
ncbi:MAG: pyridoxal phosphate-dependent aminotransferase, partial [Acidobacteriaceae bacterium]